MANGEVIKFKYTEVVADHYIYRGSLENNNELRHDVRTKYQIGLGIAWGTNWWPIRVFDFFIGFTEVNEYLTIK